MHNYASDQIKLSEIIKHWVLLTDHRLIKMIVTKTNKKCYVPREGYPCYQYHLAQPSPRPPCPPSLPLGWYVCSSPPLPPLYWNLRVLNSAELHLQKYWSGGPQQAPYRGQSSEEELQ